MDKYYNFIIIGFIIALIVLSILWAFNAVRRIDLHKNFCASSLISIAKLWRRAKFVPEDAKDRESLYLYRDFLRKFDENECKYPLVVKNGGVRAMTRKEFDNLCGLKEQKNFSFLILVASILVAVVALVVNLFVTKMIGIGIGLALIMPIVQLLLSFYVRRFNKEKNIYRDGIFFALKENSINFLSITKPFVLVDAYPEKFGKKSKPLYVTKGELTDEQIADVRNYIIEQKKAESKVELRAVNNDAEIEAINQDKEIVSVADNQTVDNGVETTPEIDATTEIQVTDEANAETENNENLETDSELLELPDDEPLTAEENEIIFNNLIADMMAGDVRRALQEQEDAKQKAQEVAVAEAPANDSELEPAPEITEPAEDDFSLDAIGQALDAEIEKRNKKRK